MTSTVLDIDALVQPIEGERPTGDDPRDDPSPISVYYVLKDARSQARAAERQLQAGDDLAQPDWSPILQTAPEFLKHVAKDVEISAYFVEALVRQHGFAGLRDGFRLLQRLFDNFGEALHPQPDEDGVETLLAPITGLNGEDGEGTLLAPIRAIPITPRGDAGEFGQAIYEQALDLERSEPEQRERRIAQGAVPLDVFNAAVFDGSPQWYGELRDDAAAASEAWKALGALLDEKYGRDSPPTSNIRNALASCSETIQSIASDKLAMLVEVEPQEESAEETAAPAGVAPEKPAGDIVDNLSNRDDAFKVILRVSNYFRKTEPHSPISYALEQIVRWGRLPLPDLWKELINDESAVTQMFRLVGIQGRNDAGADENL